MVATPAAGLGQGGIDRMMNALRRALAQQADGAVAVRFVASRGNGSVMLSPFYVIGFCLQMLAARLGGKLDLVHINLASHGSTYRKLVIAAWARALRVPYVLHLHGADYRRFWPEDNGLLARCIGAMFAGAGGIIVLGGIWRDFVRARVPETAERLIIVPNATPVPRLPHAGGGESVHILFLGRVESRKGVPELCAALGGLAALPGWRATIAGDGEVDKLRRDLKELGLAERVAVPGWQGEDDVARLLSTADILTLPSHSENLPIAVIEAMAAGLAIVTTPVGATPDIVSDGETGLLVPPGDVEALRQALAKLIETPALRRELGEATRRTHRERLDTGPYAKTLCAIWTRVAAAGRLEGAR